MKKTAKSSNTNTKTNTTVALLNPISSDFSGVEVKESNSSDYNSNSTITLDKETHASNLESEQSQLQHFVDEFIQNHQLTSRKLQLRSNALGHQLENEILQSNLRFTLGDVVHRLRKTLRERFPQ